MDQKTFNSKKTTKKQPQPFTTSTLQQKASNEFHYSPKQTMKLAQKLYEKGYITYMRTDSKAYSKEFVEKAKEYITEKFSEKHILNTIDDLIVENNQTITLSARLVLEGGESMSAVSSFSVVYLNENRPSNVLLEGLTDVSGMIFLPVILLSMAATGYIFTQKRRSESNVEVEEAGDDEFVWEDEGDASGQPNLMTTMFAGVSAKAFTLCSLYVAQGIPSGFISYTLIAYLAQQGFTAAEIGNMLFWVYLPWVFKFLWGPFVDNYHYLPMGRRRPWILGAQAGMVITVVIIALVPGIESKIALLTGLLFFHNCFASLQDVAVDGLAVDVLSPEEFGKINGFMFGAKRFGTMVGGAGIGYFIGSLGIAGGLFLTVPMLLLIMCFPAFIRERPGEKLFPWTEGKAVIKAKD